MLRHLIIIISLVFLSACASFSDKDKNKTAPKQDTTTPQTERTSNPVKVRRVIQPAPAPIVKAKPIIETDLWQKMRMGFRLPALNNKRVSYYEKRFTRHPAHFYAMFKRAEWFLPHIVAELEKRNMPLELALLPAVESAYITHAKSRSKASGLWQFIPSTGRIYDLKQDWWYDGRRDPVQSTRAALTFLGELETRFEGDWFHALAGYNAGGRTIEREIERRTRKGLSTHYSDLRLRRETKDYVPKLIAFRNIILNPHTFGLTLPALKTRARFASVDAGSQIDLNLFATMVQVDQKTLRFLNSAYKRNVTPPDGPHVIYLPVEKLGFAKQKLAGLSKKSRLQWAHYRVKSGDVLGKIAHRHGVSVAAIRQNNHLKSNVIHPGKILLIPVTNDAGKSYTLANKTKVKAASEAALTHKVRQGDTLWDIARRYGVKVAQISKWNQLNQSGVLKLGQTLRIYKNS
ncbi:MAG: LysM peptidoglycan-binding domain-containing protein [Arenicellales bacterium]